MSPIAISRSLNVRPKIEKRSEAAVPAPLLLLQSEKNWLPILGEPESRGGLGTLKGSVLGVTLSRSQQVQQDSTGTMLRG